MIFKLYEDFTPEEEKQFEEYISNLTDELLPDVEQLVGEILEDYSFYDEDSWSRYIYGGDLNRLKKDLLEDLPSCVTDENLVRILTTKISSNLEDGYYDAINIIYDEDREEVVAIELNEAKNIALSGIDDAIFEYLYDANLDTEIDDELDTIEEKLTQAEEDDVDDNEFYNYWIDGVAPRINDVLYEYADQRKMWIYRNNLDKICERLSFKLHQLLKARQFKNNDIYASLSNESVQAVKGCINYYKKYAKGPIDYMELYNNLLDACELASKDFLYSEAEIEVDDSLEEALKNEKLFCLIEDEEIRADIEDQVKRYLHAELPMNGFYTKEEWDSLKAVDSSYGYLHWDDMLFEAENEFCNSLNIPEEFIKRLEDTGLEYKVPSVPSNFDAVFNKLYPDTEINDISTLEESKRDDILKDIPDENKNGDCYQQAAHYVQSHPDATLVHGIVRGQGRIAGIEYNHAWAEEDGEVIDNTINLRCPIPVYYAIGHIHITKKYSHKEMLENMLKEKTYGPWDEELWMYP